MHGPSPTPLLVELSVVALIGLGFLVHGPVARLACAARRRAVALTHRRRLA